MTTDQKEKSGINLKQFQRFERKFPWGLIRKIIIFAVMAIAIYYGLESLKKQDEIPTIENVEDVEVEVDIE